MAETIQEVTGKTAGEYFARLDALVEAEVPAGLVRDVALPRFRRRKD